MTGARHPPTPFDPNPGFQVLQQKMSSCANAFLCNSGKVEKPRLLESINTKLRSQKETGIHAHGLSTSGRLLIGGSGCIGGDATQPSRRLANSAGPRELSDK